MLSDDQDSEGEIANIRRPIVDDHRVSKAPLHLAYTSRRNIPKKELCKLVEDGHVIQRGRFSEQENKRLWKNWRRICRKYPELNNPFAAVGLVHKPERSHGRIVDTIIDGKTRRFFKQSKILERLAYKLDDRLLCDIYSRAKRMIGGRAFKYKTRDDLPQELELELSTKLKENETSKDLSSELDISPFVLQSLKSHPAERLPTDFWNDEEDLLLEMSIERQFNDRDPWTIPLHMIDWEEVTKEMLSCGLPKSLIYPKRLQRRWYRLNSKLATSTKKRQITMVDLSDNENKSGR